MHNRNNISEKHIYHTRKPSPYTPDESIHVRSNNQTPREPKHTADVETPVFLNKILGGNEELEYESCRLGQGTNEQLSDSEPQSQVLSVNEMNPDYFHPMILSNINANCKPNINRLQLMRLQNQVEDLRQSQTELMDFMEDQKTIIEYIAEKLCLEVEDFVGDFLAKTKRASHPSQLGNIVTQYEDKLRNKNQQIQQLSRSIHEKQSELQSLHSENQHLQERIFDIEQKIVGVDLEVQTKLKERLRNIPQNTLRRDPSNRNQLVKEHAQQIQTLNQQIALLQKKCSQYQEISVYQNQIAERTKAVLEAELNYEHKQSTLTQAINNLEAQKQLLQLKSNQLLEAEENLNKKIADLRNKQSELSQWQSELTKKAAQMRNINPLVHQFTEQLNRPQEDLTRAAKNSRNFDPKSNQQPKRQKRLIVQTNNANDSSKLPYASDDINPVRKFKTSQILDRQKYDHVQKEAWQSMAIEKKYIDTDIRRDVVRRPDYKSSIETPLANNNLFQGSYASNAKYLPATNNYRDSRQASPYAHLNDLSKSRTQHLSHHFNFSKNAVSQFRDSSKDNRRSVEKNIVGKNLQNSRLSRHSGNDVEISGLGSKLQRLREELKKQIQSMK